MKKRRISIVLRFLFFVASFCATHAHSMAPLAERDRWAKISFNGIPSTSYTWSKTEAGTLEIKVDQSASAILLPFKEVVNISRVSFIWNLESGNIEKASADAEEKKSGDDFQLRVGLCKKAKSTPFIPFFAPSWIRLIAEVLKHPTDSMIYLTVGSKHPEHSRWKSPYSELIEHIAIRPDITARKSGSSFNFDYTFAAPLPTVGIWIMSDGDNSKSRFQGKLSDFMLTAIPNYSSAP